MSFHVRNVLNTISCALCLCPIFDRISALGQEERRAYFAHMQERRQSTQNCINAVQECIALERLHLEYETGGMSDDTLELYAHLVDMRAERERQAHVEPPQQIEEVEQKIISLEATLRKLNRQERESVAA